MLLIEKCVYKKCPYAIKPHCQMRMSKITWRNLAYDGGLCNYVHVSYKESVTIHPVPEERQSYVIIEQDGF